MATYEAAAGRDLKILYGGLCNQIYTHVGMLAVLLQLGAEVVRDRARKPVFSCVLASPESSLQLADQNMMKISIL